MFKKLADDANLPCRSTPYSAGFDVYSNEDKVIGAGCTELIGLGIAIDHKWHAKETDMLPLTVYLKDTHYLELHIRSSLRVKGLTSLGTGIIDIDYPDEIKIVVHNQHQYLEEDYWVKLDESDSCGLPIPRPIKPDYIISKGDKIGQLILKRHEGYLLTQEYTLLE